MNWLEITLKTTDSFDSEIIEEALFAAGALSVTLASEDEKEVLIEKNIGNQPLWQKGILITGLFEKGFKSEEALPVLCAVLNTQNLPLIDIRDFSDTQWETAWKDQLKPIIFGDSLWICPSNQSIPKDKITEKTQIITMDAGLAFGSGTHQTTAMALDYIAKHINPSQSVIDYGCGSGILGLAALKLGASHCAMVDIDPIALEVAKENAKINHLSHLAQFFLPKDVPNNLKTDVLIANILLEPLVELKHVFSDLCHSQSTLLLTGILSHQVDKILSVYQPLFGQLDVMHKDEWSMVFACNKVC